MHLFLPIFVMLFLLSATLSAQVTFDSTKQALIIRAIENLKTDMDSLMNEIPIPGAAVVVVSRDSIIWIGTYGYADLETAMPITRDTHFKIGSCTKSFTGLCLLKLAEEGRIDLNTPVREIAPEIDLNNRWRDTDPVRIIHLLEHTAGFDDSRINWFYFDGPELSLKSALEAKADQRRVRWKPGTRFGYSSPGYALAGYLIEKITGQPYSQFLKQSLLEPIGMITTTIGNSEECRQRLATGYDRNIEPFPNWYDYEVPAGAINLSIKEMAVFLQFMLNRGKAGGNQIIGKESFDRIGKPKTTLASRAGLKNGYSFGIGTKYRGGNKWYGHGGAVPGFLAEYSYNPDCGLGFAILQNQFDIMLYTDIIDLVEKYIIPLADTAAFIPMVSLSEVDLKSYCGYYEPRSPRMQLMAFVEILTGGINILYQNDTLYRKGFAESKEALIPVSENLFRKTQFPLATWVFTQNDNGQMVYASQGSYYEKTSEWKPYLFRFLVFGAVIVMLSTIPYGLVWIPIHIYKRIKRRSNRSNYILMRLTPLSAVLILLLGILKIGDQTILELGKMTAINVIFFISTLLFAGLSCYSLFTTYRSFFKPVRKIARLYAVMVSLACFGMTLYLAYWDIIGLRTWA